MAAAFASGIVPAVLASTSTELKQQLKAVRGTARTIHLDILDGQFVSQRSFPWTQLQRLPRGVRYQVHLMVQQPAAWIPRLQHPAIHEVIVHCEVATAKDVAAFQQRWRLWLAVNPSTAIRTLRPLLRPGIGVLCMGVRPGAQGQPMQPGVWRHLKQLSSHQPLAVDGGVSLRLLPRLRRAGVTMAVVGSRIVGAAAPAAAYRQLASAWRRQ